MESGIILPTCYLPPISWFIAIVGNKQGETLIEKFEHLPKQTYRNRTYIYSPNGILTMSIPVIKGSKNHTQVKDVRISYEYNWQKIHWKSLESCYRSSAFFEFYEDDFRPFYEQKFEYLIDLNESMNAIIFKSLKLEKNYGFTSEYFSEYSNEIIDYRDTIHPKKESPFLTESYYQVFENKHGFIPNLSIVDLLFNQGNRTAEILRRSVQLTK
ncbi:WbqC family protein [Solitalea koreensis]|uniref:WbqC-like protein family protein n=1 Tax=Solitalea koreensis TaxID=543615 RepID=A0A521BCA2_9SPHI|nr:WbqC family protein [Solitalea koreensis]SMO44745.1 WbqC-like protein family protein [Solitalea koreensis]